MTQEISACQMLRTSYVGGIILSSRCWNPPRARSIQSASLPPLVGGQYDPAFQGYLLSLLQSDRRPTHSASQYLAAARRRCLVKSGRVHSSLSEPQSPPLLETLCIHLRNEASLLLSMVSLCTTDLLTFHHLRARVTRSTQVQIWITTFLDR